MDWAGTWLNAKFWRTCEFVLNWFFSCYTFSENGKHVQKIYLCSEEWHTHRRADKSLNVCAFFFHLFEEKLSVLIIIAWNNMFDKNSCRHVDVICHQTLYTYCIHATPAIYVPKINAYISTIFALTAHKNESEPNFFNLTLSDEHANGNFYRNDSWDTI